MKTKSILLTLLLVVALFTGCDNGEKDDDGKVSPSPAPTEAADVSPTQAAPTQVNNPPETTPDVVTTASIVDTEEAFEAAMSNSGTWIICALKDLSFDKDLVLDGEFKNGKKDDAGKDIIQRKIALYTQDENRTVTARFTLTAPKLTVNSPNARIQSGTFKGDLYINAQNFELVDATVEGNVYFATEEVKGSFKMDEKSKVTGEQKVEE